MPERVAIIAALEREVRPFVRGWQSVRMGGLRGWRRGEQLVVCGGIGREPARKAAEIVAGAFSPQVLVSAGFAGSLDVRRKVAAVVIPKKVIDAESGREYTTKAPDGESTLLTANSVADAVSKQELAKVYGADSVDMEAAGVASVAQAHGLEFRVVKAISEEADFPLPAFGRFVDPEGNFRTLLFVAHLSVRPQLWGAVCDLRRNTARAACALALAL